MAPVPLGLEAAQDQEALSNPAQHPQLTRPHRPQAPRGPARTGRSTSEPSTGSMPGASREPRAAAAQGSASHSFA